MTRRLQHLLILLLTYTPTALLSAAVAPDSQPDAGTTIALSPSVAPVKPSWEIETEQLLKDERIFDAIERLQRQIERTPSEPRAYLALIRLLDEGGRPEIAKVIAVRAADACPDDFKCQLLGGLAHRDAGDPVLSERCLKRAIALQPSSIDPRRALAQLLIDLQRGDEAIRAIDEALLINPDNYQLLKLAATARCNAGDYAGMTRFRKRAIERRRALLELGAVELQFDEFVFHVFPVNNGAGFVRTYDGFASDADADETIITFRLFRRDGRPVAAYLLRRKVRAAINPEDLVHYRLEKYAVDSAEPVVIREFNQTEPAYPVCMNAVVADSRETLSGAAPAARPERN